MKKRRSTNDYLDRVRARRFARCLAKLRRRRHLFLRKLAARQKEGLGGYRSRALALLWKQLPQTQPTAATSTTIQTPPIFSIIENPGPTIGTILKFISAISASRPPSRINFDQHNLKRIDLAAESVLDAVVVEYLRQFGRRRRKSRPRIGGTFPQDPTLERFIRAVGLIKNIGVEHEYLTREEAENLRIFNMRNKRSYGKSTVGAQDYKARIVTEFVDHIDACLNDNGRQLTREGQARLAEYTGEILANAEDHTGIDDWFIAGYLDNGHVDHICEIAIFNFGKTHAQCFQELEPESFTRTQVDPYLRLHEQYGWFSPRWRVEDLYTLIALQGNVSTKNQSEADTRGQGTVEIIHFFQAVHNECTHQNSTKARMAILSGSTFILFDGTYRMASDETDRPVIAFNDTNDLRLPPDPKYVWNIHPIFFPGTIISIRFPMTMSENICRGQS